MFSATDTTSGRLFISMQTSSERGKRIFPVNIITSIQYKFSECHFHLPHGKQCIMVSLMKRQEQRGQESLVAMEALKSKEIFGRTRQDISWGGLAWAVWMNGNFVLLSSLVTGFHSSRLLYYFVSEAQNLQVLN